MSMQIEVHEKGATEAAVDLRRLGERGSDIRRVSEKVRTVYRRSNDRRYQTGGLGSWAPLADTTLERKARDGYGAMPPMMRTRALYKSLTAARASDQVDVRDPTAFRFGTTVPYAGAAGAAGGKKRRLIDLTASEEREINGYISRYIAKNEGAGW